MSGGGAFRRLYGLPAAGGPPLVLAPMAGYTAAPMRRLCHAWGAALAYTEMTNAIGLQRDADKTWHLLETFADEGPVVAHLYGSEPAALAEAAAKAAATGRFAGVDLNAGCPVHKVTALGAGAALVKDPQRVHDILSAMRRAAPGLPLSVKTRPGPRPGAVAAFDLLQAAESAGADAFALHARFTSQGHGGPADLALLAEVKRRAKIPVIGNGGVCSPRDAWRMLRETGVDAVMIARAAIGNPWLFADTLASLAAGSEPPPHDPTSGRPPRDLGQIREALEAHLAGELELAQRLRGRGGSPGDARDPEASVAAAFRSHLFRYLCGLKGASFVRGHLHTLHSLEAIRSAVDACLEREAACRARRQREPGRELG